MKLLMTLVVRNEADLIGANLDYHLAQGVDFVLVTDHGSTDGTDELLRDYERQGVVSVVCDQTEGHHQSRRVTEMARRAAREHRADWVIHNDADEFWWPLAGSLRDVFAGIPPEYGQIEARRVNFLPCAQGDGPFHQSMVYREAQSHNLIGDPLEGKLAHRGHPDVVVAPGNHSISGAALGRAPLHDVLEVFHFPMRDYAQFERKVVQIGLGYETLEHRSPEVGRDQLALLDLHRQGRLRRHFDEHVLDDVTLRQRLEDGSVVVDRRLADFMQAIAAERVPASHVAGASIRRLIGQALRAESDLVRTRDEVARIEAEREAIAADRDVIAADREAIAAERERVARDCYLAEAREQAVHAQLVEVSDELIATRAELERLRDSRTMRWTAPLRRRWHRGKRGARS